MCDTVFSPEFTGQRTQIIYDMTTLIILNVVIVTTKPLLHVYKAFKLSLIFTKWTQRAHCFFCGRPKRKGKAKTLSMHAHPLLWHFIFSLLYIYFSSTLSVLRLTQSKWKEMMTCMKVEKRACSF